MQGVRCAGPRGKVGTIWQEIPRSYVRKAWPRRVRAESVWDLALNTVHSLFHREILLHTCENIIFMIIVKLVYIFSFKV